MTKKKEELPDYEVEFIPIERRLSERRAREANAPFPGDRRNRGRRAEDDKPAPDGSAGKTGTTSKPPRKHGTGK